MLISGPRHLRAELLDDWSRKEHTLLFTFLAVEPF